MSGMRALCVLCAAFIGAGALVRLAVDLTALVQRFARPGSDIEPDWVAPIVSGLFVAGAVLGLPAQLRMAADRSDASRPWLFAGSSALIAALLIVVAAVIVGVHGGEPLLIVAGTRIWQNLSAVPVMLLFAGVAATAGRLPTGAGALLTAPLVILSTLAMSLEVSVTGVALSATLPFLLCAAALVPAVIAGRRAMLAIWSISGASIAAFGAILFPGWLTSSELVALLMLPAIGAGATGYIAARDDVRGAWLERAACELGGLVLALVALNSASFLIVSIPWIVDAKRMLASLAPSIMLALTFLAYIIVASFAGPLASLAIVLVLIAAAYGGGVPADVLAVGLAVAALQITVTRGTARQSAQGEAMALPSRQAGWAQTLIMIIVTALAVAATLGWV